MRLWKRKSRPPASSIDGEIADHIERLAAAHLQSGMSPEEARRRALIDFGGCEQVRQQVREIHLSALAESLRFHCRAAFRFLRKAPGFSLAVVLTLALGIGANTAVFSAIDAILLRPLPFPHGDQLVRIYQHDAKGRNDSTFVAPRRLEDWNRLAAALSGVTGYYKDDLSELSGPLPERITEALVAPRFFDVLGVPPMLGRNFLPAEQRFGGPDAVLISYNYWQRKFQGDPDVLNRKLHIGSYFYSVVGVMPRGFHYPDRDVQVWAPSPPDAPYAQGRDETWFSVIGRIKPGMTVRQAAADLSTVQARLGRQFPRPDAELTVETVPLKTTLVAASGRSLWILYGAVSLLLLIACSNIAALLLARTTGREHEMAIRYSLGAARRTIVLQLLSEVLALALLGSGVALCVAAAAARAFHLLAGRLPRADEVTLNWTVAGYTLACALLTALLCGLYPALKGTRRGLARGLAAGARTQTSTRPMQWTLVGVQVTFAVTLLVGAGLLLRSLDALGRVDPGFDPTHVLTLEVSGSWGETVNMTALNQRINRTLDGLRSLPGVQAAATASFLPGVPSQFQVEYRVDGKTDPARRIMADTRTVSSGYFNTMRIPLLAGDACQENSSTNDAVVNRSFANLYLGGSAAIGHTLQAATGNWLNAMVRGIVGDAREEGLNEAPVPTAYFCYSAPDPFPNYLVLVHGEPMAMADAIRRRIVSLEPTRSVFDVMPLQQHLSDTFIENRLRTLLLTLFAATAIALACIGLYGTLSTMARRRQREVGVRLALGAPRQRIIEAFLFQGLRVASLGCAAGLIFATLLSRFLRGMLYGISTFDPVTYAGVVALLLLVAALASLAPALRAAFLEPVKVLRDE